MHTFTVTSGDGAFEHRGWRVGLAPSVRHELHFVIMSLLYVAAINAPENRVFDLAELGPYDSGAEASAAGRDYATTWIDSFYNLQAGLLGGVAV